MLGLCKLASKKTGPFRFEEKHSAIVINLNTTQIAKIKNSFLSAVKCVVRSSMPMTQCKNSENKAISWL